MLITLIRLITFCFMPFSLNSYKLLDSSNKVLEDIFLFFLYVALMVIIDWKQKPTEIRL